MCIHTHVHAYVSDIDHSGAVHILLRAVSSLHRPITWARRFSKFTLYMLGHLNLPW